MVINYDVSIDMKIIHTIAASKDGISSISNLRYNAVTTPSKLEEHITNLVKWGMIVDTKPEKFGCARKITLSTDKSFDYCLYLLNKLKNSIEMVNEYL